MATQKANMQKLIAQRDLLLREMEALRNKIAGLELGIALLDPAHSANSGGQRRNKSTKTIVLDMLLEVGTTGLNATTAVETASRRGVTLDRGSVASLLSRLKRDDVTLYDGHKYRLREFVPVESDKPSEADRPIEPSRLTILDGTDG